MAQEIVIISPQGKRVIPAVEGQTLQDAVNFLKLGAQPGSWYRLNANNGSEAVTLSAPLRAGETYSLVPSTKGGAR